MGRVVAFPEKFERLPALLRDGWGVEDIAIFLACRVSDVRREVNILRQQGRLACIYQTRVK